MKIIKPLILWTVFCGLELFSCVFALAPNSQTAGKSETIFSLNDPLAPKTEALFKRAVEIPVFVPLTQDKLEKITPLLLNRISSYTAIWDCDQEGVWLAFFHPLLKELYSKQVRFYFVPSEGLLISPGGFDVPRHNEEEIRRDVRFLSPELFALMLDPFIKPDQVREWGSIEWNEIVETGFLDLSLGQLQKNLKDAVESLLDVKILKERALKKQFPIFNWIWGRDREKGGMIQEWKQVKSLYRQALRLEEELEDLHGKARIERLIEIVESFFLKHQSLFPQGKGLVSRVLLEPGKSPSLLLRFPPWEVPSLSFQAYLTSNGAKAMDSLSPDAVRKLHEHHLSKSNSVLKKNPCPALTVMDAQQGSLKKVLIVKVTEGYRVSLGERHFTEKDSPFVVYVSSNQLGSLELLKSEARMGVLYERLGDPSFLKLWGMSLPSGQSLDPVMFGEYVPNTSTARKWRNEVVSARSLFDFLLQLLCSLDLAHRYGVSHGDLKPDNLLIEESERGAFIKILDYAGYREGFLADFFQTPEYSSPEVLLDVSQSSKSDIFSVGALIFQILSREYLLRELLYLHYKALLSKLPEKQKEIKIKKIRLSNHLDPSQFRERVAEIVSRGLYFTDLRKMMYAPDKYNVWIKEIFESLEKTMIDRYGKDSRIQQLLLILKDHVLAWSPKKRWDAEEWIWGMFQLFEEEGPDTEVDDRLLELYENAGEWTENFLDLEYDSGNSLRYKALLQKLLPGALRLHYRLLREGSSKTVTAENLPELWSAYLPLGPNFPDLENWATEQASQWIVSDLEMDSQTRSAA